MRRAGGTREPAPAAAGGPISARRQPEQRPPSWRAAGARPEGSAGKWWIPAAAAAGAAGGRCRTPSLLTGLLRLQQRRRGHGQRGLRCLHVLQPKDTRGTMFLEFHYIYFIKICLITNITAEFSTPVSREGFYISPLPFAAELCERIELGVAAARGRCACPGAPRPPFRALSPRPCHPPFQRGVEARLSPPVGRVREPPRAPGARQ